MGCQLMRFDDEETAIRNGSILAGTTWCDGHYHYVADCPEIYGFSVRRNYLEPCPATRPQSDRNGFSTFKAELQPQAFDAARRFLDGRTKTLVLAGSTGTGKTHLSRAISEEMQGKFVSAVDLAQLARDVASGSDEARDAARKEMARINDCRVLVIDDLGSERETGSDLFRETLFILLDRRAEDDAKLNVITTNLGHEQVKDRYGEKIYSRILHNASSLRMRGTDYRTKRES